MILNLHGLNGNFCNTTIQKSCGRREGAIAFWQKGVIIRIRHQFFAGSSGDVRVLFVSSSD